MNRLATQLFGRARRLDGRCGSDNTSYDIVGVVSDYATNPVESRGTISPKMFVPLSTEPKDVPFDTLADPRRPGPGSARAAVAPHAAQRRGLASRHERRTRCDR